MYICIVIKLIAYCTVCHIAFDVHHGTGSVEVTYITHKNEHYQ